jgi:hypothetical protein
MINGYIIDKILGCRLAVIIFNCLMFTGQLIFAFGAYHDQVLVSKSKPIFSDCLIIFWIFKNFYISQDHANWTHYIRVII